MPESERLLDVLHALRDLGVDEPASGKLRTGVWDALQREIASEARGGRPTARPRRRPSGGSAILVLSVLVTAVVVALVVGLQGNGSQRPGGPYQGKLELVFRAEPTPQVPVVGPAAIARAVVAMRSRIASLLPGDSGARVTSKGRLILVHITGATRASLRQVEQLLGSSARLEFYDWEANVLTPSGKPVASLLQSRDPAALTISQGAGARVGPGGRGGGSLPLYKAVRLAAKQPPYISKTNARVGSEYFEFGRPGSAACAAAAHAVHAIPMVDSPCYLAGPAPTPSGLTAALSEGVTAAEAANASPQTIKVNQGWVVMEAATSSYGEVVPLSDPTAQFYVLRDNAALSGDDITSPQESTDQAGSPDVTFKFTAAGANKFQRLTATIAKRGQLVSGLGQRLFQHFAVALDTQIITVPYIDYLANPFGIPGNEGADIQGGFTVDSARALAKQLSLAALPVKLALIARKT